MNHPRLRCILAISASALLNLLLIALLYKEEKSGHWIQKHIHSQVQSDPTERPDYWCIMGWNNTIKKLNIDCDICFFGHSQIAMSDFQQDFPNRKIVTLGYPGDNVDGILLRVDQIHPSRESVHHVRCQFFGNARHGFPTQIPTTRRFHSSRSTPSDPLPLQYPPRTGWDIRRSPPQSAHPATQQLHRTICLKKRYYLHRPSHSLLRR